METEEGEIHLSKSTRSLTGVERARDEPEQVLCELENLPLAPFPAAHLCSLVGRGGAWKGQHKKRTLASQFVCFFFNPGKTLTLTKSHDRVTVFFSPPLLWLCQRDPCICVWRE